MEREHVVVDIQLVDTAVEVFEKDMEEYFVDMVEVGKLVVVDNYLGKIQEEQQCHKHPKENTRKIPKQTCKNIVDTIYIETCEERIHTQCEETHERGHHSTRVASHDSQVIASSSHSGHQEFYGGSH